MDVFLISTMFQLQNVMPPKDWIGLEQEFNNHFVNNSFEKAKLVVIEATAQWLNQ